MNVCCVYTVEDYVSIEKPLHSFESIPFGIAFIATALKQAKHDISMLVITPGADYYNLLERHIKKHLPKLICLTAVASQYTIILDIARAVHQIDSAINIIIGGHHASLNPSEVLIEDCFDAVCIGEGERAVVEYASQIKSGINLPSNINNLWIKNRANNSIEKNDRNPFVQDLDSLPFIDRSMWEDLIDDKSRLASILLGRGCPNKCTYCSNHALAKLSEGKYVRFRSPENIVEELKQLIQDFPEVTKVYLEVETLSINLKYVDALCEQLKKFNAGLQNPPRYGVNLTMRKKLLENDEFLPKLKAANFEFINIGLESGSERVRREILKRPKYDNGSLIKFCNLAKEVGIEANLFVLVGIPGETLSDFKETIACTRECNPQHVHLSIFYPYPGTDLFFMARDMGVLQNGTLKPVFERRTANLDLPGFSKKQIQREFLLFYYNVYKGRLPFYKIASRVIRELVFLYPMLNELYIKMSDYRIVKPLLKKLSTFRK
ncbi:MAG: radical SAM protein [Deltaproteobacteria bacterium]|jgi:anaerobic magnesium-protoporphyrin IX monomethyl ester cyclase|nr:radical SAM protein [Deltaproteobacteria bacterium]MBT4090893.1 radical SAM protein [Deltaproteobacteria bacterium]MBT4268152.1 radical SAM protein [Deltaproteobacteria bacterium]MBT4640219.1 radical SAM protein [Deltaproteobacteria bacterium]MBT7151850.1 radical SAM protein [Deltaproteobacteria bacterium]